MVQKTNLNLWDVIVSTYLVNIVTPVYLIAWIVFSLIFTYQSAYYNYVENEGVLLVIGVILFIFFFILIQIYMFLLSAVICAVNPKLKKGVLGEHTFEIMSAGLKEETAYNETLIKWPSIDRVVKIIGYTMLRVAGSQWHVFPKRSFENNEAREEFISELRRNIQTQQVF